MTILIHIVVHVSEARNTILSHVKLVKAVKGCHDDKVCIFHGPLESQASCISGIVRRFLAKFRMCKQTESALNTVRSKANN